MEVSRRRRRFSAGTPGHRPLFNTYEHGGYLIWRLWPQARVFIDGRALSESIFMDYARILYNHDATGGKSAEELLDQYGIQAIVMNSFEYANGLVYLLARRWPTRRRPIGDWSTATRRPWSSCANPHPAFRRTIRCGY